MLSTLIPSKLKSIFREKINEYILNHDIVKDLQNQVKECKIHSEQLQDALRRYHDLDVPPPMLLQKRVVGDYYGDFIESGFRMINDFQHALMKADKKVEDFNSVLDFGCGCGRVIMAMHKSFPQLKISGSDIDEEAIEYCKKAYSSFGDFQVNPHNPPSLFADNSFDFIYGISVFTHLPEEMQFNWLRDLKRISKKGAYLFLTVENEKCNRYLNSKQLAELSNNGFYFYEGRLTEGLPDFYRMAFHSHDYVRNNWSKYFEIIDIIPLGMGNHQDVILCKNNG
ncbi:MAG: methyltransferase domain-containing protein [Bacteroidia bacterium]